MATRIKRKSASKKPVKKTTNKPDVIKKRPDWHKCKCGKDSVYMRRNRGTGDMEHWCADCFKRVVENSPSFKKAVKMAEEYNAQFGPHQKKKPKKRAVKRVKK